jgi:hypothetical protein
MHGRWLLAGTLLAAVPATGLATQVAPNRTTAYLHPTDVRDARALWVNPAGLATVTEASVHADVTVGEPGANGRLRQLTAGFNSRGLSFAYQRDVFDSGVQGHTYRLGLGGGGASAGGLAAGFAIAHYRGAAKATGWDLGVTYSRAPALTLGGTIANIGQPVVRGERQRVTLLPGVTWRPLGPMAAFSAHARLLTDSVLGYAVGISWQSDGARRWPIAILARLDTDDGLRRAAFVFGLSIGGADRVGLVLSAPGDVSEIDAASVYGVSMRTAGGRRRR